MLDFPNSPIEGEVFVSKGVAWTFRNGAWVLGAKAGNTTQIVDGDDGASWQVWGDTLICWGQVIDNNGPGVGTVVTFPRAFQTGEDPAIATSLQAGDPQLVNCTVNVVSETSFTAYAERIDTGGLYTEPIRWVAIGEAQDVDKQPKEVAGGGGNVTEIQIVDEGAGWQIVGGKLIQFGVFSTDASGEAVVTYTIPYEANPAIAVGGVNAVGTARMFTVVSPSTTGFIGVCQDVSANASQRSSYWMAVGDVPAGMEMPTEIQVIGVDGRDYMDRTELAATYLDKQTSNAQQVTGVVNFENHVGMGGDIYMNRDIAKNESGIVYTRDNGHTAGYLFWDESGDKLALNTYDSAGVYTGTKLELPTASEGTMSINTSLTVAGNTIAVDEYTGVNSHVYFRHNGVNHALIYSPQGSTGVLNFNHYNNAGAFLSQSRMYHTGALSRHEAGDVVATDGRYYGPEANFGASIQNTVGGVTTFGDLGFHRLVGGGSGPVGVYLELNNNGNVSAWGVNMDFTSDPSTKTAVQPSQVDALKAIGELLPIRWTYNDKAPRLRQYEDVDLAAAQRVSDSEFGDNSAPAAGPVDVPYTVDDTPHDVELGFMSDDIKRIAPDAVYECDGVERIDYRLVVPHCLRAIQQLTERLEALENS